MKEAVEKNYPYTGVRTALFVCDFIVLYGYGYIINPRTGRRVQGIRKTS